MRVLSISTFRLFNGNSLFSSKFTSRFENARPQYSSIKIEKIQKVYITENDDLAELIHEKVEMESTESYENSGDGEDNEFEGEKGNMDIAQEMENRVKRLKRTCKLRRKIQNLVDSEDYDRLMALHETIYDVEKPLPSDDTHPGSISYLI